MIGAIELAATYNLKVIAKNPGITDDPVRYVSHPNVYGIIVEKGAGGAADMEALRKKAGKPEPAGVVRRLRLRPQLGGQRRQRGEELSATWASPIRAPANTATRSTSCSRRTARRPNRSRRRLP